jgi:hypothetical protein
MTRIVHHPNDHEAEQYNLAGLGFARLLDLYDAWADALRSSEGSGTEEWSYAATCHSIMADLADEIAERIHAAAGQPNPTVRGET